MTYRIGAAVINIRIRAQLVSDEVRIWKELKFWIIVAKTIVECEHERFELICVVLFEKVHLDLKLVDT